MTESSNFGQNSTDSILLAEKGEIAAQPVDMDTTSLENGVR
ncbi:MAG: hypothetical protein WBL67_15825 [Nitrososphaeraceae archaeon]